MKRIISLVTVVLMLASFCMTPSIADESIVISTQSETAAASKGNAKMPGGKTDSQVAIPSSGPVITSQPVDVTAAEGTEVTFTVVANGGSAYQWYFRATSDDEWAAVEVNGNAAAYTMKAEAKYNGYQFRCIIKSKLGETISDVVTLTVQPYGASPASPAAPSADAPVHTHDESSAQPAFNDYSPAIISQPCDVSVIEGENAVFTVTAKNATSYQWYFRASAKAAWTKAESNGTDASYSLKAESKYNGYQFRCILKNKAGETISKEATLTVLPVGADPGTGAQIPGGSAEPSVPIKINLPVITTQPSDQSVSAGQKATFKVVASNATSYQWYYAKPNDTNNTWNAVSNNGSSATYTLTTEARHNGYRYRCLVSNSVGSIWSSSVKLTVKSATPVITTQPANQSVSVGQKATFKVVASGATAWQWYYKKTGETSWNAVSNNGTAATYTLTTAARHNGYQYCCLVSNNSGSVWSSTAKLTVKSTPVITTQPTNKSVNVGANATFKVVATGATAWQWYYMKPGETSYIAANNGASATYTLTTAARHNGFVYKCKVSNSSGYVWSNVVKLTVVNSEKPTITSQPSNVTVNVGKKATFKVLATNVTGWQWYYKKPGESSYTAVSNNGTSATYTLTTAARHDGYMYKCKVSNNSYVTWSNVVKLTVTSGAMCGDNLKWSLDSNGVLTITGTGAMWTYEKILEQNPSLSWRTSVKQVKIGEGVTTIGDGAFESCTKLTKATLPSTLKKIGQRAFKGCTALATITSP